jgi:hypothetical protein
MATMGVKTGGREQLEDTIRAAVAEAVADREGREIEEVERPRKGRSWMSVFFLVLRDKGDVGAAR